MSSFTATVENLRHALRDCNVSLLDEGELRTATAEIRTTERLLAAFKMRVGQRANELSLAGAGADAGTTLLGVGDVSAGTARTEAARADVAEHMPGLADALTDGRIAGEHLDAVARATKNLDAKTHTALQDGEEALVDAASRMPVDVFNRHVRRRVDQIRNDHGLERAQQQRAQSEFRSWTDATGMGHFRGQLDPERFTVLTNAIERQTAALANDSDCPVTKNANLAAAALVELVSHGNGRHGRPHISLVVDAETALAGPRSNSVRQTTDGSELPPETIDRFACDSVIRKIVVDQRGVPIDVGRNTRTATEGQWAALKGIYTSCAWSGCSRPVDWCQAHHIHEWEHSGATNLGNLIPLCSQHHHSVHEGKWTIKLLPDRTLRIHRPDGAHWADSVPDRLEEWLADRTSRLPKRTSSGLAEHQTE